MKILVVFLGGTIGSSIKYGVTDIDSNTATQLMNMYGSKDNIDFESVSPFNILSENSTVDTLSDICNFMLSINYERYNGVIVTHGSDTLAYTSAMLGILLSWVNIPVVITAADYVISIPFSNGIGNFRASVDFIRGFCNGEHKNTGVFTVWKNKNIDKVNIYTPSLISDDPFAVSEDPSGDNAHVYISTRLNEADGYNDLFSSWGDVPFGIMRNGKFERIENEINPPCTLPCDEISFLRHRKVKFKNNILLLKSYPGLDFDAINLEGKRSVILQPYHSVTTCTEGSNTSALNFIDKCITKNIDVYLCSTKSPQYSYKSSQKLLDKKLNPLYNINVYSAYAKVLLANTLGEPYKKRIVGEPYCKNRYPSRGKNLFYEELPHKIILISNG